MKILHVITTLDVGGAEMHLLSLVRGQCERGHAVRVAWLRGNGSLRADFEAAGAEWLGKVGQDPALPLRLWPHLRWAERVHTHLLKADMAGAMAAALAGRRRGLVSSKHNDEQVLRRGWVGRVHGALGRLPRRTIVLSDHVGRFIEQFGRVPRARQERIYYGIDPGPFENAAARLRSEQPEVGRALRKELGVGPDDVVFLCVARFAPQKAHDVLLRAFERALTTRPAEGPAWRLVLVGDDPFGDGRERAEALARQLKLEDSVRFTGIRRDVPELYAVSDVFVMASLWEGLGLVYLEAMAADLPILASDVSAVPEVVEAERTGVLVPPGEVDPLAAAIARLAGDAELRQRLGAAGRERVRARFGLERMIEETLALYASL